MTAQRTPISSLKVNHVLIADDDLDHTFLFRRILSIVNPNIQLSVVADGEELLDFLYFNTIDLLFLDLSMPCKTGFVCLNEIRKDPRCKNLPIVVYSSSSSQADIRHAYSREADLYVVKPFSSSHLENALRSILDMGWVANKNKFYFINNSFVPVTWEY